jgi:hypothetical protein
MNGTVRQGRTMMAQTVISMLNNLLITEADRRRARIELQKPVEQQESAQLIAIDSYKAMLED